MPTGRLAVELQLVGAFELFLVDVGGSPAQVQQGALGHLDSLEDLVPARGPRGQTLGRRSQAHGFLGELTQLLPILLDGVEDALPLAQQLGLLLQRVLRRLEAADDHGVDDAVDLGVGELAAERFVFHLGQEGNHVVLGVLSFLLNLVVDVLLESVQQLELVLDLLLRQDVAVAFPVHEGGDLSVAPFGQLGNVLLGKAEHVGHHHLGEGSGELGYELYLALVDPVVDEAIGAAGDHLRVPICPRSHPRVRQLLPMGPPQLDGRPQRHHRDHHGVRVLHVIRINA